MKIEQLNINDIKPYDKNPRKNDKAVDRVANSIKEFGFQQPIVVDKDMVIVVGHTRYKAAQKLKLSQIPVVIADVSEEKLQAYRIADNKLNELAEWDDDLLFEEISEITARGDEQLTGFSAEEINAILNKADETAYTTKIDTPIYTPKGEKPLVRELYSEDRCTELIVKIKQANIPEDIKDFLIKASYRHRVFDYENIAEFYAHADDEVKTLMEDSALVIIDFNKAIELGYVNLTKDLKQNYIDDHGEAE